MKANSFRLAIAGLALSLVACSVVKQEDPEKSARAFLRAFELDLSGSDDAILARFRVSQSKEAVLSVIRILQNKDPFIVCDVHLADGRVERSSSEFKVSIPAYFSVKGLDSHDTATHTLRLTISKSDTTYLITSLEGEPFYRKFMEIKNRNFWEAEEKLALESRTWIFERARQLEQSFDSVIWYSSFRGEDVFYVVKGKWVNYFLQANEAVPRDSAAKMGLVDANGNVLIPTNYDLVGSVGFLGNDLVEVKRNNKVGYFSLETRNEVIPPVYDYIIPCRRDLAVSIVKKDSAYGWIDTRYAFHFGFPSPQVERWVKDLEFLKSPITLSPKNYKFAEIPSPSQIGNGIIVPPAYLYRFGLFDEIEAHISTTNVPIYGWSEFREKEVTYLERIADNIVALVSGFRERYLEGREEFYLTNRIVFLNNYLDTLTVATLDGEGISIQRIDSGLLEVKVPHSYWFGEYGASLESNLYNHTYFNFDKSGMVRQLATKRLFPQTQFIKLDSSYLEGSFLIYENGAESTKFLSEHTITFMRDEIYSSYGYIFPDEERLSYFKNLGTGYEPKTSDLAAIEAALSEIDRYNLAFLNRVLERMKPASV